MPVTLQPTSIKYKNDGVWQSADTIKGDDYVLTEQDKEDIAELVEVPVQDVQVNGTSVVTDGVANVPRASSTADGTIRINGWGLTWRVEGTKEGIALVPATEEQIRLGTQPWAPVVPNRVYAAAFYGLAKAAGDTTQQTVTTLGHYTETAKSKISEMLNGSVAVTGTTPTITALSGIQYVCGEVSTLDITLPESGIVDVVFESGSTPTVLTITPPTGVTVKWANGFDPTSLEANTTYELNIKDGLGVAGAWS